MKISSKIWTLLLSFVVAFGLWLYVITVVSPESEETYYDIPVTYQNDILEELIAQERSEDMVDAMRSLREEVDQLERILADATWPLPKYRELLFLY